MSPEITPSRWQAALSAAAQQTLAVRWRTTLEALRAAQLRYRALYSAERTDIRALRRAAKRIYDLEQLRTVLATEFRDSRPWPPGSARTSTPGRRSVPGGEPRRTAAIIGALEQVGPGVDQDGLVRSP